MENSQDSEEVGLPGFSVMETGFNKTTQELCEFPKVYATEWMKKLFYKDVDESKSNKNKEETVGLNMISHSINIIRLKMTQNIYSPTVEEKFLKEHPLEDLVLGKESKGNEEFCVPVYFYLDKGLRFAIGYVNIEKGEALVQKLLVKDVKIRCSN
jgi:hypothetical protein